MFILIKTLQNTNNNIKSFKITGKLYENYTLTHTYLDSQEFAKLTYKWKNIPLIRSSSYHMETRQVDSTPTFKVIPVTIG